MKKFFYYFIFCLATAFVFSSCEDLGDETFDESLLIGRWVSGTVHYKYSSDHYGATWDTADDVTEAEAQRFSWTLDQSDLTHIHIMEVGGEVPKYYTVTELTESTLKYKDSFNSYSFVRE